MPPNQQHTKVIGKRQLYDIKPAGSGILSPGIPNLIDRGAERNHGFLRGSLSTIRTTSGKNRQMKE
jgi:hypothetical protein